eukprot:7820964-Pyramimonas_sp.AAC.1
MTWLSSRSSSRTYPAASKPSFTPGDPGTPGDPRWAAAPPPGATWHSRPAQSSPPTSINNVAV